MRFCGGRCDCICAILSFTHTGCQAHRVCVVAIPVHNIYLCSGKSYRSGESRR
ncbi:hypothetical protein RchiOBHm_Chr2g0147791 [Rosa chinensis]|uniref:Uncharacterized protein n=1 Tax=Rosa chinensis TaxID=74649 RepID=A0A2P6RZ74_ROSCH|nr:hypothetical protein RchiOBHm_Chr2g0147791 [Rosa chinensis]